MGWYLQHGAVVTSWSSSPELHVVWICICKWGRASAAKMTAHTWTTFQDVAVWDARVAAWLYLRAQLPRPHVCISKAHVSRADCSWHSSGGQQKSSAALMPHRDPGTRSCCCLSHQASQTVRVRTEQLHAGAGASSADDCEHYQLYMHSRHHRSGQPAPCCSACRRSAVLWPSGSFPAGLG